MIPRLLQIELVPRSTWYDNARSRFPQCMWRELRCRFLKPQCQICGYGRALSSARLFLHEVWRYDDANHVQKLVGFMSLCMLCHSIKHLGLAGIMAQRGDLDYGQLIKHYCSVNGCTEGDFFEDRKVAFEAWRQRSQFEWTLDLSYLGPIVEEIAGVKRWMREHSDAVAEVGERYGQPT